MAGVQISSVVQVGWNCRARMIGCRFGQIEWHSFKSSFLGTCNDDSRRIVIIAIPVHHFTTNRYNGERCDWRNKLNYPFICINLGSESEPKIVLDNSWVTMHPLSFWLSFSSTSSDIIQTGTLPSAESIILLPPKHQTDLLYNSIYSPTSAIPCCRPATRYG